MVDVRSMLVVLAAALLACAAGCAAPAGSGAPLPPSTQPAPERWGVRIERNLPHDPTAFTQGFEIDGGRLLEGTGRSGQSRVTATDLTTGVTLARVILDRPLFGEGITLARSAVPPTLWQLTWRDGVAIARDPVTLAERRRVPMEAEGWGICTLADGSLITSDGSATLTRRDPTTFTARSTIQVASDGVPRTRLNELECTPDGVYANVWQTDTILLIDPNTGAVRASVDASPLRAALGSIGNEVDVLNGIAAVPGTDRFLMTGKLWPSTFEVTLVRGQ